MSSRARLSRCSQIHRFRRARLTRCTSDILGDVHREKKMQLASSTEATNQRLQLACLYEYSNQTKAPCIWQTWPARACTSDASQAPPVLKPIRPLVNESRDEISREAAACLPPYHDKSSYFHGSHPAHAQSATVLPEPDVIT